MRKSLSVRNDTRNTTLISQGEVANTAWERGVGLIGHAPLQSGEGLMINPCRSVHTFWMKFPIDVLFVNAEHQVVHLAPTLAPGRVGPIVRQATYVLELPAGAIAQSGTQVGDVLTVLQ